MPGCPEPFVPPTGSRSVQAVATQAWLVALLGWVDENPADRWRAAEDLKARSELVFPAFDPDDL